MFGFLKRIRGGRNAGKPGRRESLFSAETGFLKVSRASLIFLFTAAAVFCATVVFLRTVSLFLLLFAGILMAVMVTTIADFLREKTGAPHRVAVTVVLAAFLVLAGLAGWLLAPPVAGEIQSLSGKLMQSIQTLSAWLEGLPGGMSLRNGLSTLTERVSAGELGRQIGGIFSSTIGALGVLVLILWVGVYLAYDPETYSSGTLRLVPARYRKRASEILSRMAIALRWWLIAQLISMVFISVLTWAALALIGVPLPLALALITGIFNFIPYLGPLIALVPILLLAFLKSPLTALWAFILTQALQTVEGNILLPLVYQKTVRLPPVLTILSQLLFGTLFGLPGVLLATPLAVTGMVAVRTLYLEDVLGEETGESAAVEVRKRIRLRGGSAGKAGTVKGKSG